MIALQKVFFHHREHGGHRDLQLVTSVISECSVVDLCFYDIGKFNWKKESRCPTMKTMMSGPWFFSPVAWIRQLFWV
jgi:hypothetical protein